MRSLITDSDNNIPTPQQMHDRLAEHYGDLSKHGWRVRQKWRFQYFSPELWYEAVVDQLVNSETTWIDIGGGSAVFPGNAKLSKTLADRCHKLVGVDPSANIHSNPFVHQRVQAMIEDFETPEQFDLATFRMVAEHIQQPEKVIATLRRLIKPGGKVVIYTPSRWSASAVVASMTPHQIHTAAARLLWKAKEEDVFPTAYKMNTRRQLREVFEADGFEETDFRHIADCSILQRFRWLYPLELLGCRLWTLARIPYPESNLLGVYQRTST
jgi:2-polyprenyl-3-methyl-5-hydroxy-6-metoxy-1,4-benzoquinol methylase